LDIAEIVIALLFAAAAAFTALFGIRQLACKGYCFNNAYIYASKEERETKDFTPYYKQSGRIFLMISGMTVLDGLFILFSQRWFMIAELLMMTVMIVYAVRSSVKIAKENKENKEKENV